MPVIPASSSVTPNITGKGMIKRALRLLGAKQSNEDPTPTELADGLEALNSMLDAWNNENLVLYATLRSELPLVAAQEAYTIGSGEDFDLLKPGKIENVRLIPNGQTGETKLRWLTDDQYASISDKTATGTPNSVWFDGDQTFHFYPVPTAADTFVLYAQTLLLQIADTSSSFTMQTGFKNAIEFNLAVDLGPEWGKEIPGAVVQKAIVYKANLKRAHIKPLSMRCDTALQPRRGNSYNIYTNEPN